MWPFKKDQYVRSGSDGTVTAVRTGVVSVNDVEYPNIKAPLVYPGQQVKKNQPIGKKP